MTEALNITVLFPYIAHGGGLQAPYNSKEPGTIMGPGGLFLRSTVLHK